MSNEPLVLPVMQPYSITIPHTGEGTWTHSVRLTWDPTLPVDRFTVAAWPFWMKTEILPLPETIIVMGEVDPRANIHEVLSFIDTFFAEQSGGKKMGLRSFNPVSTPNPAENEDFRRALEEQFDKFKGVKRTYAQVDDRVPMERD